MGARDFLYRVIADTGPADKALAGSKKNVEAFAGTKLDRLRTSFSGVGNSVRSLDNSVKGLRGSMTAMVTAGTTAGNLIAAAIGKGVSAVSGQVGAMFSDNSNLEQATATFTAFTKDANAARDIVNTLRKEADVTPFDTAEMIESGKSLISVAGGSKTKLMELIKESEILAALNPAEGLKGAAFALKEAVSGDFTSVIERFNISRASINKFKDQGLTGINVVRAALKEMGADSSLVDKLANTFEGRKSTIMSFFSELRRKLGEGMFKALGNAFGKMTAAIGSSGTAIGDIASGIGIKLGEWFSAIITGVPVVLGWFGTAWSYVKGFAMFIWELPGNIVKAFNDGSLGAGFAELIGNGVILAGNILWAGVKFLGRSLWDLVVAGIPWACSALAKLLVDGLRGQLSKFAAGAKISEFLGLDGLSEDLKVQTEGMGGKLTDGLKSNMNRFKEEDLPGLKANASVLGGSASNLIGNTLGGNDAMKKANSGPGVFDSVQAIGAKQRQAEEAEAAKAKYNTPAAAVADKPVAQRKALAEAVDKSNGGAAKYQIQFRTQENINPVMSLSSR